MDVGVGIGDMVGGGIVHVLAGRIEGDSAEDAVEGNAHGVPGGGVGAAAGGGASTRLGTGARKLRVRRDQDLGMFGGL